MKIVKRIGVFETNSSSTHSISIVKNNGIDKNTYTVQIVSAEEKLIWLRCMIKNAEDCFACQQKNFTEEDFIDYDIDYDFDIDEQELKELGFESKAEYIIFQHENAKNRKLVVREKVISFKDSADKLYCQTHNISPKKLEKFLQEKVIYVPENSGKCRHNLKKGQARQKEGYETYNCLRYFDEGALDDCDCGFESYSAIYNQLNLYESEEKVAEYLKWFLSEDCKIVAKEKYRY